MCYNIRKLFVEIDKVRGVIMKYYLVALFDNNSYQKVESIQRSICKKYKLYKKLPVLYINLEVINEPDIDKLDSIISEVLKPYKRFKVELKKNVLFDSPCKSLNLEVESKGYISRIARNINEKLIATGFDIKNTLDALHIPLANTNFNKKWEADNQSVDTDTASKEMARVDRIELWKAVNNKKTLVIKSYPLKEY